jgi:hypothetical protein
MLLKVPTGSQEVTARLVLLNRSRYGISLCVLCLSHRRDVVVRAEELEVMPELLANLCTAVTSRSNSELFGEVIWLKYELVNQTPSAHGWAVGLLLVLVGKEVVRTLGELLE